MKSNSIKAVLLSVGFIAALLLSGSGCGKGPTDPQPVEDKDYVIYFGNEYHYQYYYSYHTKTGVFDTFELPYGSDETGFAVSPDGSRLYLNPPGKIVEVETDSFTIVAEHLLSISRNYVTNEVLVTPDGRYLISKKADLAIVDLSDYSVVYQDSSHGYNHCAISLGGRYLYCSVSDSTTFRFCLEYDLADNFATREWRPTGGHVSRLTANHDSSIWYVYFDLNLDFGLFQVYDPERDTILFGKSLRGGYGDMQVTLDDKTLFLSQPGNKWMGIPGPTYFLKINTSPPYSYDTINSVVIDTIIPKAVALVNEFCMTPDGRHLIGTSNVAGQFFDYDIQRGEYNRAIHFSMGTPLKNPVCQSQP